MAVCNKDCFHCPYPDCINDGMNTADYRESREIERNVLFTPTRKQQQLAQYRREYREANKEKIAQYRREYREANKEKIAQYQREYREANKEKIAQYQREYYEANREKIAQRKRECRKRKKQNAV